MSGNQHPATKQETNDELYDNNEHTKGTYTIGSGISDYSRGKSAEPRTVAVMDDNMEVSSAYREKRDDYSPGMKTTMRDDHRYEKQKNNPDHVIKSEERDHKSLAKDVDEDEGSNSGIMHKVGTMLGVA